MEAYSAAPGGAPVSEQDGGERLVEDNRHLAPYGVGGDYVGARRARRAFRFLVISWLAFAFALYYVEHYLRYDLNEVHYRMALTLEDDSQRAILRNVVRKDAEDSEVPRAKYVEALAHIEEDDVVLERFAEAVKLAPDKGALLINYGCRLFQQGRYKDARQVFRDASLKSTRNALPKYLQAAALAASSGSEEDFRTALAQVGRANDAAEPVIFPQPLWHESLPRSGDWYVTLRRRLADQCCAPLYYFKNVVTRRAQEQAADGDRQTWDTWLAQIQVMGEHLVGTPRSDPDNLGTSQAIYGLQIQKDAIAMRIALGEQAGKAPPAGLIEKRVKIEDAMGKLQRFEAERSQFVTDARARLRQPLLLALNGFLALGGAWVLFALAGRVLGRDKNARTLPQHPYAVRVLLGWSLCLFLVLGVLSAGGGGLSGTDMALGVLWYLLVSGAVVLSAVYPAFVLPAPADVCSSLASEPYFDDKVLQARACRRRAWASLSVRNLGLALGLYVMLVCTWVVGYRIVTGLYPTDTKLLLPGLEGRERELLYQLQGLLQS